MKKTISYMLDMLRSIVRGTDRMCSKSRCYIRKQYLAETLSVWPPKNTLMNDRAASSIMKGLLFYEVFYLRKLFENDMYFIRTETGNVVFHPETVSKDDIVTDKEE